MLYCWILFSVIDLSKTSTINHNDTCVSEYYPNYKEAFEYIGAVTYSHLGNALVYCCDARKMTDTVKKI